MDFLRNMQEKIGDQPMEKQYILQTVIKLQNVMQDISGVVLTVDIENVNYLKLDKDYSPNRQKTY